MDTPSSHNIISFPFLSNHIRTHTRRNLRVEVTSQSYHAYIPLPFLVLGVTLCGRGSFVTARASSDFIKGRVLCRVFFPGQADR